MKPNSNIETTVGMFLLLGIGIICTLILFFGEVKDIFKPTYSLTVTFPNASGLLKGSDVFLSGAHIGKVTTDPTEARQWLMAMDQSAALQKLQGAVEYLKSSSYINKDKIGVIGFCMGGFLALNLACHSRDIRVATPFYGRIPPDDVLQNLSAPVLYFFGEQDHHLPAADVDRLEQFIKSTGRSGGVVRYPQADHAFFNDTRAEVYREADAKDAWGKALGFLRNYLEH